MQIRFISTIILIFFTVSIFSPYLQYAEATIYSSISGTIRDAITGKGIDNFKIMAIRSDITIPIEEVGPFETITDVNGNYILDILPSGSYHIFVAHRRDDYVNIVEYKKIAIIKGKNIIKLDFYFSKGGSISGTVYQADGITPLPNAELIVRTNNNGFGRTFTDINGKYTITSLPTGVTDVNMFVLGFYQITKYNIEIKPGQSTNNINLVLPTTSNISLEGEAKSSNTLFSIKGAIILLRDKKGNGAIAETDDNGKYSFRGIPKGTYTAIVYFEGFKPIAQEDIIISETTLIINFSLPPINSTSELSSSFRSLSPDTSNSVASCIEEANREYQKCIDSAKKWFGTCLMLLDTGAILCILGVYLLCRYTGPLF